MSKRKLIALCMPLFARKNVEAVLECELECKWHMVHANFRSYRN